MTLKQIWNIWCKFWFEPKHPAPSALFRICFGLLLLQSAVFTIGGDFLNFYGKHGFVTNQTIRQYFWWNNPRFDGLLIFGDNDKALTLLFGAYIIALVFLTVGYCTRYSAAFVAMMLVSMHLHDPYNLNGGDSYSRLVSLFLPFSMCGKYWSLDAYIAKKFNKFDEAAKYCPWAERMIQVQLCMAYAVTEYHKISGAQWLDGKAVYYAIHLDDMCKFTLPFSDSLPWLAILTWYTLFVEFTIWTLIWIKELSLYVIIAGVILHLGIDIMIDLPAFEWFFMCTYVLWLDPQMLINAKNWCENKLLQVRSMVHKSQPNAETIG